MICVFSTLINVANVVPNFENASRREYKIEKNRFFFVQRPAEIMRDN